MPKVLCADQAVRLTDIPNVGPVISADLQRLGIDTPQAVRGMDPVAAYEDLCLLTGQHHDPCVLDVFMAAHDFMNGGAPRPWWKFTAQRKAVWHTVGNRKTV